MLVLLCASHALGPCADEGVAIAVFAELLLHLIGFVHMSLAEPSCEEQRAAFVQSLGQAFIPLMLPISYNW
eukprot:2909498-Rhodomonas_salina.2